MKYTFLLITSLLLGLNIQAQERVGRNADAELDSLRKLEEEKQDTVIFTSKFIRYTTLSLLQDSTQTLPLDTTLNYFHHYNPLNLPYRPTVNLGNVGIPYREMLFSPRKNIGFDPGFHSLDMYRMTQDSIKYYRARTPFTSLYYVNGTRAEQIFKVAHSQNIKPNWNVGLNYNRLVAEGFYTNHKSDHLNAAVYTWYESPKKRYNLLANGLFNTLKAGENGSIINDSIFEEDINNNIPVTARLNDRDPVKHTWKQRQFFLKQFYYLGRLDSAKNNDTTASILPTQRISHSFSYSNDSYKFYNNQSDPNNVFPGDVTGLVKDSTNVKNLRNEFMYSFYLRGRSLSFIKNELKLDVGLQHDHYRYEQARIDTTPQKFSFQNVTLKGDIGYRFSNRVSINGKVRQIAQGRDAGDYYYDAETQFLLSRSVGRIVLGAYIQNNSPEHIYEQSDYTFNKWPNQSLKNTKINNLSFSYINPKFEFKAKAEYFLINNYLYFAAQPGDSTIAPVQSGELINMIKVTANKHFRFGRFNLESFLAVQKTDFQDILRTPEIYTYNSFYYSRRFSKAVAAQGGFDIRWNSKFAAPSYAINVSQFYNGPAVEFDSFPIVDLWARFALNRANVFVRYDYANQGLFSKGYYTVNRYPMPDALFKFGVAWNFYD